MTNREMPELLRSVFSSHGVLEDVLVAGYVDRGDEPPTFQLYPSVVCLRTDRGCIKFDASTAGSIAVSSVSVPVMPPELVEEPSVEPMFARMSQHCFGENQRLSYHSVTLFVDAKPEVDVIVAAEFELAHGNRLLLDADWTFGIRFSAEGATAAWRDLTHSRYPGLAELRWERDQAR